MAQIDDGGPAFPVQETMISQGSTGVPAAPGMSLRDYFAGQALQGMCSPLEDGGVYPPNYTGADYEPWPEGDSSDLVYYQSKDGNWRCEMREDLRPSHKPYRLTASYEAAIARGAYRFADAMLSARKSPPVD